MWNKTPSCELDVSHICRGEYCHINLGSCEPVQAADATNHITGTLHMLRKIIAHKFQHIQKLKVQHHKIPDRYTASSSNIAGRAAHTLRKLL